MHFFFKMLAPYYYRFIKYMLNDVRSLKSQEPMERNKRCSETSKKKLCFHKAAKAVQISKGLICCRLILKGFLKQNVSYYFKASKISSLRATADNTI
jgi:hypothetical protein